MSLLVVIGIAVGLAMDAFAVAVGTSASLGRVTRGQVFRFGFHFGLFQAVMPLIGWLAGRGVHGYIAGWDHWVAFGLLAFIGGKAITDALRPHPERRRTSNSDPTRGLSLLMLSVATSIDALAVGLSLGVMGTRIWLAVVIIGVITAALTVLGMHLGSKLGSLLGRRFSRVTEIVGGVALIGIGLKILVEHVGA